MIGKGHKGRQETISMLSYTDFLRMRQEKENIINNPFEENWKKAVVMEELLNLYGTPDNSQRGTPVYSRAKRHREDDDRWDCNEDNQLSKYYKMVDGLNRWETYYQQRNIGKIAGQVETRSKHHQKAQNDSQPSDSKDIGRLKRHKVAPQNISKQGLGRFHKLISRNIYRGSPKNKQILQLEQIAADKYGVHFSTVPEVEIDPKTDEFKRRDREIFQQFIGGNKQDITVRPQSQNCPVVTDQNLRTEERGIKRGLLRGCNVEEVGRWMQGRRPRAKKQYIRL